MLLFLDPTIPVQAGPWEWLIKYALPGIGWPVLIVVAWKMSRYFSRAEDEVKKTVEAVTNGIKAIAEVLETLKESAGKTADDIKVNTEDVREFKRLFAEHLKSDDDNFRVIRDSVNAHFASSGDVAKSIQQLAEAIHHQSDVHAQQFEIIRGIAEKQAVLGANQSNITQVFQRVVEQLISLVKE